MRYEAFLTFNGTFGVNPSPEITTHAWSEFSAHKWEKRLWGPRRGCRYELEGGVGMRPATDACTIACSSAASELKKMRSDV